MDDHTCNAVQIWCSRVLFQFYKPESMKGKMGFKGLFFSAFQDIFISSICCSQVTGIEITLLVENLSEL